MLVRRVPAICLLNKNKKIIRIFFGKLAFYSSEISQYITQACYPNIESARIEDFDQPEISSRLISCHDCPLKES